MKTTSLTLLFISNYKLSIYPELQCRVELFMLVFCLAILFSWLSVDDYLYRCVRAEIYYLFIMRSYKKCLTESYN